MPSAETLQRRRALVEKFAIAGAQPALAEDARELTLGIVDLLEDRRELIAARAQDLRYWKERVAEVGSLKRRITALRRSLKLHRDLYGCETEPVLNDDDAARRRFERKARSR